MSLKFNEAVEILVENLSTTIKPEQEIYMQDVDEISKKIDQELININSIFKGAVTKWDQTFMFCNKPYPKTRVPMLWVDIPFPIEPQQVFLLFNPGCKLFNLKTVVNHPAVHNGYVSGEKLISLFYFDLNRAIDRMRISSCKSGKKYNISTSPINSPNMFYNIVVKEYVANGLEENPLLLFKFHLMFNFSNDSVLYTYLNNFFLQAKKSKIETKDRKMIKLQTNAQKLLLQLQVADKSLILEAINLVMDSCVDLRKMSNTGDSLLSAIDALILMTETPGSLICVFGKLLQFKESDSVKLPKLLRLFGLQK
ncbi:uncharacterized protein [Drosophila takahashii]|uniref:uncharacterized protein n=1 Tax=Drosophila takahashii TaxID=29030 RepID=UPI00389943AB